MIPSASNLEMWWVNVPLQVEGGGRNGAGGLLTHFQVRPLRMTRWAMGDAKDQCWREARKRRGRGESLLGVFPPAESYGFPGSLRRSLCGTFVPSLGRHADRCHVPCKRETRARLRGEACWWTWLGAKATAINVNMQHRRGKGCVSSAYFRLCDGFWVKGGRAE